MVRVLGHELWILLLLHPQVSVGSRKLGNLSVVHPLLASYFFPVGTVEDIVIVDGDIHLSVWVDVTSLGSSTNGTLLSISERVFDVGLLVVVHS